MLYPELFKQLEAVRWDMEKDIPWGDFDAAQRPVSGASCRNYCWRLRAPS